MYPLQPATTCSGSNPIHPLTTMSDLLNRRSFRYSLVVGIVLLCLASIEVWGYYNGLNVLVPVSFLCLLGAFLWRNAFLGWVTLCVFLAYVFLSAITIAE